MLNRSGEHRSSPVTALEHGLDATEALERQAHRTIVGHVSANADWMRALQRTATIQPDGTRTLYRAVAEMARRHPDRVALIDDTGECTYAGLIRRARAYAGWALSQELSGGDVVALMMANNIDYIAIWIGLSQLGIITALLNTSLTGDALTHTIRIARPRHIIVDTAHAAKLQASIPRRLPVRVVPPFEDTDYAIDDKVLNDPDLQLSDQALLIYTSGTTGFPKAARVSHYRIMMWAEWFAGIMDAAPDDRLYNCLPLYHSVGGVVAVGAMLVSGGTVIIRKDFSASGFWPDLISSGATILQYIGELCRYLLPLPAVASTGHHLRLCCGNGLQADVWSRFQDRFGIPRIIEFYAATEGSFSLFNLEGRPGAIGRIPPFMAHRSPMALVHFDRDKGQPIRDLDGHCIRCVVGEVGEALGCISKGATSLATRFEGYTSAADTETKILRNVFSDDDQWFRTGDLMRRDAKGFYFFVDRIGDTFRWKGENVATAEVAAILARCAGVDEVAVFGVNVPCTDGRAGMAALVVNAAFDIHTFKAFADAQLPRYAVPVFLRLCLRLERTGSFKIRKSDLAAQSYDSGRVTDPLFIAIDGAYAALSPEIFSQLQRGQLRL